jgi:multicomponent Na+:H+ antiporter subunit C
MLNFITDTLQRPNYIAFVILFLWGMYIAIAHHNLVKKLIGLYLVQTSVLLFLVSFSAKRGATVPILLPADQHQTATSAAAEMGTGPLPGLPQPPAGKLRAGDYVNPLPHALTLTGIVVQVATLGVSLALVVAVYQKYNSLDEEEILKRLEVRRLE